MGLIETLPSNEQAYVHGIFSNDTPEVIPDDE